MVGNIVIVALRMVFFIIFAKNFKDIFFTLYLNISVLLSNISFLLKYISLVIIIFIIRGNLNAVEGG